MHPDCPRGPKSKSNWAKRRTIHRLHDCFDLIKIYDLRATDPLPDQLELYQLQPAGLKSHRDKGHGGRGYQVNTGRHAKRSTNDALRQFSASLIHPGMMLPPRHRCQSCGEEGLKNRVQRIRRCEWLKVPDKHKPRGRLWLNNELLNKMLYSHLGAGQSSPGQNLFLPSRHVLFQVKILQSLGPRMIAHVTSLILLSVASVGPA
jgi:hypothetical protein